MAAAAAFVLATRASFFDFCVQVCFGSLAAVCFWPGGKSSFGLAAAVFPKIRRCGPAPVW